MMIIRDKYELPLAIGDTMDELVKMAGVEKGTISEALKIRGKRNRNASISKLK